MLSAPSMVMSWGTWWQARAGLLSSGTNNAAIFMRICAAAAATGSEITSACYGPCLCTNAAWQRYCSGMPGWVRLVLGHDFNSWAVETRRGSIPPLRRCVACCVAVVGWCANTATCPCSCGSWGKPIRNSIGRLWATSGHERRVAELLFRNAGVSRAGARI